jgi:hypothetical protein
MRNRHLQSIGAAMLISLATSVGFAQAGQCQHAQLAVDPSSHKVDVKAMSSGDLKEAISYAVQNGDLDAKDGKELIDKIVDIETLMDQFDFIRDHERSMMSSVGSSFH